MFARIGKCPQCKLLVAITLLHFFFAFLGAAQSQDIRGVVLDAKTKEPLPFANVFVNNTTIGTTTDDDGDFRLMITGLSGRQELIFSFVGYELLKIKVLLDGTDQNIGRVELSPNVTSLNSIEIVEKRDRQWERNLKKFKRIFLGETRTALGCKILNPWVINFEESEKGTLVTAQEPIQIRNEYLGYMISFYLNRSYIENIAYSIQGGALFQELSSVDDSQTLLWTKNRYETYLRSSRHFFKSLVNNQVKKDGFLLYEDVREDHWHSEATSIFRLLLSTAKVQPKDMTDNILPDTVNGITKIRIDKRIEVHYSKARTSVQAYDDIIYPVSWLLVKGSYLRVNSEGIPLNQNDLITSGDMNQDWITRMLPTNYQPPEEREFKGVEVSAITERLRERIYVHTDKSYYYPGEIIWFKAYLKYHDFQLRDSLSKVMYVDLIDEVGSFVESSNLLIHNGIGYGDFRLPRSLEAGKYYLRAYTSLMRNFGDSTLYVKPIPVLDITKRPKVFLENALGESTHGLEVVTDKPIYSPREKIKLTIRTANHERPVSSHLSISVTDSHQVIQVQRSDISGTMDLQMPTASGVKKFKVPVESGITIQGVVLNHRGKKKPATVTMLDVKTREMFLINTDKDGDFWISGLGFYDSAEFIFQAKNKKGKTFGSVELVDKKAPEFLFLEKFPTVEVEETDSPQRIIPVYEAPEDARMLDEVVISGSIPISQVRTKTYGRADYVLKAEDINTSYGNLLLALQANSIPGLVVRQAANEGEPLKWVVYTQRTASLNLGREVLVTLNDVAVNGVSPANFLATIDPATVESIGFTSRINPLYGEQGAFGVLSIYSKLELSNKESKELGDFEIYMIKGYALPRGFPHPDYEDLSADHTSADYRSTIYWNPNVVTDASNGEVVLTFFAGDLAGLYNIVVEGLTYNGVPLRGEYQIDIGN